jgi:hypothetical protein
MAALEAIEDPGAPTKERLAHGRVISVPTEDAGVFARKAVVECVLDRYWRRMQITDRQFGAGEKFRSMWIAAVHEPSVTSSYGERRGKGGGAITGSDARKVMRRALLEAGLAVNADSAPLLVMTKDGSRYEPVELPVRLRNPGHLVVSVCGLDEWAGGTARLMMLREGLSLLADYWGFEH